MHIMVGETPGKRFTAYAKGVICISLEHKTTVMWF